MSRRVAGKNAEQSSGAKYSNRHINIGAKNTAGESVSLELDSTGKLKSSDNDIRCVLDNILVQLKINNMYLQIITNEQFSDQDIEE